jgi:hypothetical protein
MASFGWLAVSQPTVLFSHIISALATSHQPASSTFSLTTNQHQPSATSQPNEAHGWLMPQPRHHSDLANNLRINLIYYVFASMF